MDDLAVVEAVYAAAQRGDWEGAEAHLSDDLVITEAAGLPYAGVWRGKTALRDLFAHVMGFWDAPQVHHHAHCAGDGHVIGVLTLSVASKRDGRRHDFPLCELFRLEGGKVVEIRPYYFDTAAVAAAV